MTFTVTLEIAKSEMIDSLSAPWLSAEVPFRVEIAESTPWTVTVVCHGVRASGLSPLPEALRLVQAGLSSTLRRHDPIAAARGGLQWREIRRAEVVVESIASP